MNRPDTTGPLLFCTAPFSAWRSRGAKVGILAAALMLFAAWQRPQTPNGAGQDPSAAETLDFMVLKVAGKKRVLRNGETLRVVEGDPVTAVEAVLRDKDASVERVNVVGFKSGGLPTGEDRGESFDTGEDLIPSWSENEKGRVYAVTARSGEVLHGRVYLALVEPALKYAVALVNGKKRIFREGQTASLGAKDRIKLRKVVTNLDGLDGVRFSVAENTKKARHELRFSRRGRVFARIPVRIEE